MSTLRRRKGKLESRADKNNNNKYIKRSKSSGCWHNAVIASSHVAFDCSVL